jgi:hypothetical protein
MSIRGDGLKPGTRHYLKAHTTTEEFEWTGRGWSTPGSSYNTPPGGMMALGWGYISPVPGRDK